MESKVKYSIHSAFVLRGPCSRYKFSKVVLLLKVTSRADFSEFSPGMRRPLRAATSACAHVHRALLRPVLQCVAVCCSVLQCVAVCCSVLQCVAVCCSVLQCVAVCCSVLQCVAVYMHCCTSRAASTCVAVCCSLLRTSHTTAPRTLPRPMYI